jgi:hypothetical protein
MAAAVESPLNLVWSLKSQISKSVKVSLQRQSVVGCKLTRVAITAPSQVGNAMRRRLNVTVEEAIRMIDETMTAVKKPTRIDLKHLLQCPQFLPSGCRTLFHFLSRMVCPLCPLASLSRVNQQHNQHTVLHQDIAAEPLQL